METIKYFNGGVLIPDAEIKAEDLLKHSFYNKVYVENDQEIKSEFYSNGKIVKVIYFNYDINKTNITGTHLKNYGPIEFEICNRFKEGNIFFQYSYYFNSEGVLQSFWLFKGQTEWHWDEEIMFSPEGEKLEIIKIIYNQDGKVEKELHYRGDGTFWYEQ